MHSSEAVKDRHRLESNIVEIYDVLLNAVQDNRPDQPTSDPFFR
ncbi:MAG: hypothetical protein ACOCVJ_00515 [Verrucomicrobiota bacterium]